MQLPLDGEVRGDLVFIFVFIPFSILQSPYPSGERLFFGEKYLKGLAPCLAKVRQ